MTPLALAALLLAFAALLAPLAIAGQIDSPALTTRLHAIAKTPDSRIGIAVRCADRAVYIHGDDRFPMQSVMKLVVGATVLAAADRRQLSLDESITIHRQDLSLFVQPLADLVTDKGFTTTLGDLIKRAVAQSDSAAVDMLLTRVGGPQAIAAFLEQRHIEGIRVDRNEKHLQTDIMGLEWLPEFVDPKALTRAVDAVPKAKRDAAFTAYLHDERDTATPRGMATFLHALAVAAEDHTSHSETVSGALRLLSQQSAARLIEIMKGTTTFPDRLRAGTPQSWTVANKTGTSDSWDGVTAATNDIGILFAPDGTAIELVVFVADSSQTSAQRAALIASVAKAVAESYR